MGKYDALGAFLGKQSEDEVAMTFAEIEKVTATRLPRSAYEHRPWWSNNGSNSVLTKVWLNAGFRSARVDMANRRLVFVRERKGRGFAEEPKLFSTEEKDRSARDGTLKPRRHPLFGAMKGTFTIEPGYDLTQPAMPEWADMIDEKYGPEKRR